MGRPARQLQNELRLKNIHGFGFLGILRSPNLTPASAKRNLVWRKLSDRITLLSGDCSNLVAVLTVRMPSVRVHAGDAEAVRVELAREGHELVGVGGQPLAAVAAVDEEQDRPGRRFLAREELRGAKVVGDDVETGAGVAPDQLRERRDLRPANKESTF